MERLSRSSAIEASATFTHDLPVRELQPPPRQRQLLPRLPPFPRHGLKHSRGAVRNRERGGLQGVIFVEHQPLL
jgi:hypothetical protein